jgi:site-specific DNA-methyltransferase (adenine-specific)
MTMILYQDLLLTSKSIPDNSIDIIIADPPYNIGKDFGNKSDSQTMKDYIEWCKLWLVEFERVLKPTGTGYIYGFSEILAHISVNLTLPNRWLIWHYTNKNVPGYNFWQRSHESIICFWKDSSQRIFNEDAAREPYTLGFLNGAAGKVRKATKGRFSTGDRETIYAANENGAMGRDVLKVPALAGGAGINERVYFCKTCNDVFMGGKSEHEGHELEEHPTQKPMELTCKLLQAAMPKTDAKVFIPFAGTGSECMCCKDMGLDYISCDINENYVQWANKLLDKYVKPSKMLDTDITEHFK